VTGENRIVKQLRGVAAKLTSDLELQKDLLQEMFIHLVRVQAELPKRTLSWYIKSCEFQARNCLKHGRSIDSPKRASNLVPLGQVSNDPGSNTFLLVDPIDPIDLQSELITNDIVDLITLQLTDTQQQIFFLLIRGLGVREIARELRITHPAVIKHRRKIARIALDLLRDTDSGQVNGNGSSVSSLARAV